jgi:hypothetical protein
MAHECDEFACRHGEAHAAQRLGLFVPRVIEPAELLGGDDGHGLTTSEDSSPSCPIGRHCQQVVARCRGLSTLTLLSVDSTRLGT